MLETSGTLSSGVTHTCGETCVAASALTRGGGTRGGGTATGAAPGAGGWAKAGVAERTAARIRAMRLEVILAMDGEPKRASSLRRQVAKPERVCRQTNGVDAFILVNATFVAWRCSVTDYRVYVMNPQNRIVRAVELFCASDQEAQDQVRLMPSDAPLELWQRARFLGRYDNRDALGATPRPDVKT